MSRPNRASRRAIRPRLEQFEDRRVPASLLSGVGGILPDGVLAPVAAVAPAVTGVADAVVAPLSGVAQTVGQTLETVTQTVHGVTQAVTDLVGVPGISLDLNVAGVANVTVGVSGGGVAAGVTVPNWPVGGAVLNIATPINAAPLVGADLGFLTNGVGTNVNAAAGAVTKLVSGVVSADPALANMFAGGQIPAALNSSAGGGGEAPTPPAVPVQLDVPADAAAADDALLGGASDPAEESAHAPFAYANPADVGGTEVEIVRAQPVAEQDPELVSAEAPADGLSFYGAAASVAPADLVARAADLVGDLCGILAGLGAYPWVLAAACTVAVAELYRRRNSAVDAAWAALGSPGGGRPTA